MLLGEGEPMLISDPLLLVLTELTDLVMLHIEVKPNKLNSRDALAQVVSYGLRSLCCVGTRNSVDHRSIPRPSTWSRETMVLMTICGEDVWLGTVSVTNVIDDLANPQWPQQQFVDGLIAHSRPIVYQHACCTVDDKAALQKLVCKAIRMAKANRNMLQHRQQYSPLQVRISSGSSPHSSRATTASRRSGPQDHSDERGGRSSGGQETHPADGERAPQGTTHSNGAQSLHLNASGVRGYWPGS